MNKTIINNTNYICMGVFYCVTVMAAADNTGYNMDTGL